MPCAEVMASRHQVTGYDIDPRISSTAFKLSADWRDAVLNQDLVFIAVPTPHDERYDGRAPVSDLPPKDFSYDAVREALGKIHSVAPASTVVLISTVLPGTVRSQLAPLLPQGTLIYNPYFIAMGTVKEDFLRPEMLPVGTSDGSADAIAPLVRLYESLIENPPVVVGTWEEAEAIKIFYNTFISFKLSFVNMIQDVAERVGHMNTDVVTRALSDARGRIVSPMYMKAGMGDGGPCHPRDNIALRDLARRLDLGYDLFGGIIHSREQQARNLAKALVTHGDRVCLLGVGFKPGCALVDGSSSLLVAHYLRELGATVSFYDPRAGHDLFPADAKVFLWAHPYESWSPPPALPAGCVAVDPWRTAPASTSHTLKVYGDTRP